MSIEKTKLICQKCNEHYPVNQQRCNNCTHPNQYYSEYVKRKKLSKRIALFGLMAFLIMVVLLMLHHALWPSAQSYKKLVFLHSLVIHLTMLSFVVFSLSMFFFQLPLKIFTRKIRKRVYKYRQNKITRSLGFILTITGFILFCYELSIIHFSALTPIMKHPLLLISIFMVGFGSFILFAVPSPAQKM